MCPFLLGVHEFVWLEVYAFQNVHILSLPHCFLKQTYSLTVLTVL